MPKFQLLLFKSNSSGIDITGLCETVKWGGRKGSAARTVTAKLIDDDGAKHERSGVNVEEGHQIMLLVEGKEVFRGIIMSTTQTQKKVLSFKAYDNGIYLANNKDTYCYENKTATAVFNDVLSRLGLPVGEVAGCSYTIPELTKSKTTAFDVIADALSLDYDNTGVRHFVSSSKGKISLLTRKNNILQWVIEPSSNLIDYSLTKSIEKTKTRIKLVSDEGKVLAEASNSALEAKIGMFQEIDRPDETLTQAQITALAKSMLAEKAVVANTLTLDALGIPDVISGVGVFIKIKHLNISQTYYVDQDEHLFEGEKHTMTLKLNVASDAGNGKQEEEERKEEGQFKKGDKVILADGARTYNNATGLQSWCYGYEFEIIQVGGNGLPDDRIVIGINGQVTAAVKASDLSFA